MGIGPRMLAKLKITKSKLTNAIQSTACVGQCVSDTCLLQKICICSDGTEAVAIGVKPSVCSYEHSASSSGCKQMSESWIGIAIFQMDESEGHRPVTLGSRLPTTHPNVWQCDIVTTSSPPAKAQRLRTLWYLRNRISA